MDFETGLPDLPEGYFWRLTDCTNEYGGTDDVLELRRKNCIGSNLVHREDVGYPNELNVGIAADEIMRSFKWELERDEARARLQGDYPPKRLA